jgi:hypothetical protein
MLSRGLCCQSFAVALLLIQSHDAFGFRRSGSARDRANADVTGVVTDSATGQPVAGAQVSVANQSGAVIASTTTSTFGAFTIHNLAPNAYSLNVRMIGFRAEKKPFIIMPSAGATQTLNVALSRIGLNLEAMQIKTAPIVTLDSRTGNQIFRQNTFHSAPATTTSQIIQASIAGAARAPTGEVHIRGQHAEYTFYVDGVPVPPGISGSLNELFDPDVVDHITFQTGGWDAEYGGRITAVVNITTKIPTGGLQGDASAYGGGYTGSTVAGPTGSNGQSATVSDNRGPWGFFLSSTRQFSDMRLEPVVIQPNTGLISNFHNAGTDLYGFGKLQYTRSTREVFTLEGSLSTTEFAVPFDSSGGAFQNDHQNDANSFLNLGWHRQIGDIDSAGRAPSDVFGALFYRHASLRYDSDPNDDPSFQFFPDTNLFNLSENRSANIYGLKLDYAFRRGRETEFKIGTLSSVTSGHEDFSTFNGSSLGPQSNVGLNGYDVGFYGQTAYSLTERFEIRAGLRYDAHSAPDTPVESQLSPRIRLNFYPSPLTTAYLYYGRLFMPTNIEDLRTITSAAQGGQAAQPTVPERDNFYEAAVVHRFPRAGIVTKLAAYHKDSNPGIDDNTIPGSAIVTDVNIAHIRITGIEGVLELNPPGPVSGYLNAALNHAYGFGTITGGFFPAQPPTGAFDLDHDQRVSIVASGTYSPKRLFLSGMIIYGSGLTNGVDPAECHCSFGTGLFDFNSGVHVSPNTIFNAAGGYSFVVRGSVMTPQLYVENLFNKTYLLKGAFFSGPSVGRPRSFQLKLKATF